MVKRHATKNSFRVNTYLGLALSQPLRRFLQVMQPERVHGVPDCRFRFFFTGMAAEIPEDCTQPVSA